MDEDVFELSVSIDTRSQGTNFFLHPMKEGVILVHTEASLPNVDASVSITEQGQFIPQFEGYALSLAVVKDDIDFPLNFFTSPEFSDSEFVLKFRSGEPPVTFSPIFPSPICNHRFGGKRLATEKKQRNPDVFVQHPDEDVGGKLRSVFSFLVVLYGIDGQEHVPLIVEKSKTKLLVFSNKRMCMRKRNKLFGINEEVAVPMNSSFPLAPPRQNYEITQIRKEEVEIGQYNFLAKVKLNQYMRRSQSKVDLNEALEDKSTVIHKFTISDTKMLAATMALQQGDSRIVKIKGPVDEELANLVSREIVGFVWANEALPEVSGVSDRFVVMEFEWVSESEFVQFRGILARYLSSRKSGIRILPRLTTKRPTIEFSVPQKWSEISDTPFFKHTTVVPTKERFWSEIAARSDVDAVKLTGTVSEDDVNRLFDVLIQRHCITKLRLGHDRYSMSEDIMRLFVTRMCHLRTVRPLLKVRVGGSSVHEKSFFTSNDNAESMYEVIVAYNAYLAL